MAFNEVVRCPAWAFPAHEWALTEAADATTAADTGYGSTANLELKGGAAFLGPDAGGGLLLSNPTGDDGRFPDFGGGGLTLAAAGGVTFAAFVRPDSFQNDGFILSLNDGGSN